MLNILGGAVFLTMGAKNLRKVAEFLFSSEKLIHPLQSGHITIVNVSGFHLRHGHITIGHSEPDKQSSKI